MSEYAQATAAIATYFESKVKHAYQTGKLVANYTRKKNTTSAGKVHFPVSGALKSTERQAGRDVVAQGDNIDSVTAVIKDFNAPYYIFDEIEMKTAYDDIDTAVEDVTKAIERRCDQVAFAPMIEAAKTAGTIASVADTVNEEGTTRSGMNLAKILAAQAALNAQGVPQTDRYFAVTAQAVQEMLQDTKIASGDYNPMSPLLEGQIAKYVGFNFIMIDERDVDDGGLPKSAGTSGKVARQMFAWHKDAIGTGMNRDIKTRVDYVPHKNSTLCNAMYSAGSVLIDRKGLVVINTNENEIPVVGSTANLV